MMSKFNSFMINTAIFHKNKKRQFKPITKEFVSLHLTTTKKTAHKSCLFKMLSQDPRVYDQCIIYSAVWLFRAGQE